MGGGGNNDNDDNCWIDDLIDGMEHEIVDDELNSKKEMSTKRKILHADSSAATMGGYGGSSSSISLQPESNERKRARGSTPRNTGNTQWVSITEHMKRERERDSAWGGSANGIHGHRDEFKKNFMERNREEGGRQIETRTKSAPWFRREGE